MQNQLLYKDLARYYDLIYSWKDYKKEAATVKSLIKKFKKSKGSELLEAACGTGKHAQYLKEDFSVLGTDVNKGMVDMAKKKVKGVAFKQADMINLNLRKQFDIIVCLFSSIGYVKTPANLQKTIRGFARHLKPGGIALIEPWFTKATYNVGTPHMTTYGDKEVKIARLNVSKVKGSISILDMHYLVAERNKDVRHFSDRHELAMFEIDEMLALMNKAGLKAKFLKNGLERGRGLLVGIKS